MKMDRREFLRLGAAATAGSAITGLVAPWALSQESGKIREFHLSATPAKVQLGVGPEFVAWTYNGRVPGPEIRVKEGEVIRVVLRNFLPEDTTIHWHGIPLKNEMDGVPGLTQAPIRPGEGFVYEFEARPSGTYIYHSHVAYQLDQGLYGPLIIEPSRSDHSYDRQYVLMLEDWVTRDGGGTAPTRRRPRMGMMGGMMRGP